MTASEDDSLVAITAALRATMADLDGYIERRAVERAAPMIAAAEERAEEKAAEVREEILRREHLGDEFRRCLTAKDQQIERWREVATGKAVDLILRNDEVRVGDWILDGDLEVVRSVDVYDDHLGIAVTREDDRDSYLDRQPGNLTAVRREIEPAPDSRQP
jgi:hypothetical protein